MIQGLVIKSTGSWYTVIGPDNGKTDCKIKGSFRLQGIKSTNPIAVGDNVVYEIMPDGVTGIISEVLDRKNYIVRKSTNLSKQSHILAANIDMVLLLVTAANPETSTTFIDRYIATCEAYRIPVTLLFNKIDIFGDLELERLEHLVKIYTTIGYDCLKISVKEGTNMQQVRELLKGKISMVSGNSGTGKSSLINYLEPSFDLKTDIISTSHNKGKHTTTFPEMFLIPSGGYIIDTPGIKAFGSYEFQKNEMYHFFKDIFKYSHDCQFYNCNHTHEPGCNVQRAVQDGNIFLSRFESYLSLISETSDKYRKKY